MKFLYPIIAVASGLSWIRDNNKQKQIDVLTKNVTDSESTIAACQAWIEELSVELAKSESEREDLANKIRKMEAHHEDDMKVAEQNIRLLEKTARNRAIADAVMAVQSLRG